MELNTVLIVGAGTMGSGIAQVSLQAGLSVTLCDTMAQQLEKARKGIETGLAKSVAKGKMTPQAQDECLKRITYTDDLGCAGDADIIIEAIQENLEAKKRLFAQLSQLCRQDAVLASNTSTISITAISAAVSLPERFLGMHFFNPVPAMKLLEIIPGLSTAPQVVEAAKAFGERLKKVPVTSKDSGGFIANRIGSPMLNAAVNLLDSGVGTREDIDSAMKFGYGYPMGPLELIDLVGVDVQVAVMEVLYQEFGDPYYKPAPLLKRMLAAGHLGRKSGKGFYEYPSEGSR